MIKTIFRLPLFFLILSVNSLSGQISYSGKITPSTMIRLSDQSEISLPFRLIEYQLRYSRGGIDLITNTALEARWVNSELTPDVREAYLMWFPSWGEVRFGKQIHAWGSVDGNNPTDNLNPYDYYFMFLPGTDRKIGVLSASVKYYSDWWNLEAVVIPEHHSTRMTFGEKDFPIKPPFEPEEYVEIGQQLEFGARWQINLDNADISISTLEARDRSFSLFGMTELDWEIIPVYDPHFGYRKTRMLGLDGVTFFRGITFRGETAFFKTWNDLNANYTHVMDAEAEYIQYVVQVEFTLPSDISVSTQFIGNEVFWANGTTINLTTNIPLELDEDNFSPGMGTPFAMLADQGLMFALSRSFMDDDLELSGSTFYNLEMNSYFLGGIIEYSLVKTWKVQFGLTQFFGNEDELEDSFNDLEDFSHVQVSLEYNF